MISLIILAVISFVIIVFYIGGLLVFTPYEEDDKYVLKILELGFQAHDSALDLKGIFRFLKEIEAKFLLEMGYFILKDRKYTKSKEIPKNL